jgi:hypothetical protein
MPRTQICICFRGDAEVGPRAAPAGPFYQLCGLDPARAEIAIAMRYEPSIASVNRLKRAAREKATAPRFSQSVLGDFFRNGRLQRGVLWPQTQECSQGCSGPRYQRSRKPPVRRHEDLRTASQPGPPASRRAAHAAWLLDAGYIDGYTGKPPLNKIRQFNGVYDNSIPPLGTILRMYFTQSPKR